MTDQTATDGFLTEPPNSGPYTTFKVTQYTNGESEAVWVHLHEPMRFQGGKKSKDLADEATDTGEDEILESIETLSLTDLEKREENKKRSLRRAKTSIRKKVIEGNLDTLLTLTYRENKTDSKECWKDWARFIRKLRVGRPNLKYVVVYERQKRGAVHFHCALNTFLPANSVRRLWLEIVGDGNIDLQRKKHNQPIYALARYLAKYLSKQIDDHELFNNLYRASQNIRYIETRWYLPVDMYADARIIQYFTRNHGPVRSRMESEGNYLFTTNWISTYT